MKTKNTKPVLIVIRGDYKTGKTTLLRMIEQRLGELLGSVLFLFDGDFSETAFARRHANSVAIIATNSERLSLTKKQQSLFNIFYLDIEEDSKRDGN